MAHHIDTAGALAGNPAAPGPAQPAVTQQAKLGIVDYVHNTSGAFSHEIDLSHPDGKRYQIVFVAMHESGAKPNLTISVTSGSLTVVGRDTENVKIGPTTGTSVQILPNPAHARLVAELDLMVVNGNLEGTMYAAGSDSHIQGAWYQFTSTNRKLTFACSTAGAESALHVTGYPHG